MNTNKHKHFGRLALIVFLFLPVISLAQDLKTYPTRAAFRDAAVDAVFGRLFVAANDRNEVWVYNPQTLERISTLPVGKSPSSLAISSDGAVLACVNRVDATVTLVRIIGEDSTSALSPIATLALGAGPTSIAPTPDGRFIIANSFADSISFVDPRDGGSVRNLDAPAAVPVDAAMSGSSFAVVSRTENAVYLYDAKDSAPGKTIKLDSQPTAIETLSGDAYLVSSAEKLYVVNAESGAITASKALAVQEADIDGDTVYVYSNNEILQLDSQLNEVGRTPLSDSFLRIVSDKGVLLALNARDLRLAISNRAGVTYDPTRQHTPEIAPAPVVIEAAVDTPVEAPQQAAAIEAPAETVEEAEVIYLDGDQTEPEPKPEPAPDIKAEVIPEPQPDPSTESTPSTDASAPTEPTPAIEPTQANTFRYMPVPGGGVRAPRPGGPSADPRQPVTNQGIMESLLKPTEFASAEAGFKEPDWSQPFRDVQFDSGDQDLNSNSMDLQGNVHLTLGDMNFKSDAFKYDEGAGELHTSGNVHVVQGESTLTADSIHYSLLAEGDVPPPLFYEAPYTESDISKKRLTLGRVTAQNVHVIEPTRVMKAETFEYDMQQQSGSMTRAFGKAGLFYYSAEEMTILGPNSFEAKDLWVTPCDCDEDTPPAYRLRLGEVKVENGEIVSGKNARLQIRNTNTPFYIPFLGKRGGLNPMTIDVDTGRRAELGLFLNVGQPIQINSDITAGPRIFITEDEGVGFGGDVYYDFMNTPSSRLFRTKGELHALGTTEDRGYLHWYHRYAHSNDLLVKTQVEQWSDEEFYKDFFFEQYRDRTSPRTFANVTWRQPEYIVQGTVDVNTHNWVTQRESLPEASFSLMDRPLADRLYVSFDSIAGYYQLEPDGIDTARSINIARLSLDLEAGKKVNIMPFLELEASAFSNTLDGGGASRFSSTLGANLQTRLQKTYGGALSFSGFKHIILPSLTLSYTPDSSMDFDENPKLDTWDARGGRTRVESKIDNVFYGKDAESGDVWQVGRITFYQGNDITSDNANAADYEIEIDVRPRPWWGWQFVAERHETSGDDLDFGDDGYLEYLTQQAYENLFDRPFNGPFFESQYGDFSRILTELYYDNTAQGGRYSGRLGFARTATNDFVFNREILYGMGYRINDKWALSFEHRYDFDDNELRSQTYEIRRSFQCWDSSVRFRDRQSGFDVDFAINLSAFPGTKLAL